MTFIVSGRIHPERADVHIYPLIMPMRNEAIGILGTLKLWIIASQMSGSFDEDAPVADVSVLKQAIEDACRQVVDAFGFSTGCGYDVEITQITNAAPDVMHSLVFGVQEKFLLKLTSARKIGFNEIAPLLNGPNAVYIRRCLADLREAIRNPAETAFYCYRAIESLKQVFKEPGKSESEIWQAFRDSTGADESIIRDKIKVFADELRHGKPLWTSQQQRQETLEAAWDIALKFFSLEMTRLPSYTPFNFVKPEDRA